MTLLHIYVFLRLYSLRIGNHPVRCRVVVGAGVPLWLMFILGRNYGGHEYGFPTVALEVAAMHWMGIIFLVAAGFFVADLACGFGLLFPKAVLRIRTSGLACGLLLVVVAHTQGLRPPTIETYDVTVNGLPAHLEGTTVAVMSDLHAGEMMVGSRWLSSRIDQVQSLSPDLVVLVGDLFERGSEPEEMASVLRRLSAPLGVWAVRGNHDRARPGRRDVAGDILAASDIRLLTNEWIKVTDGLVLAGIDDLTSSRRRPGEGEANIERALADRPEETTIFLSHTPWLTGKAAAAGVDLMLSGHTHNGQIWPFNHLVGIRYPFIQGSYDIEGMKLIVSRGTGTWGPRMRLWAPGEISFLTLRAPA